MDDAQAEKLKRHIVQMLPRKDQIPQAEREHFVRHLKGVLSTVGDMIEIEMLKHTT